MTGLLVIVGVLVIIWMVNSAIELFLDWIGK